MKTMKIAPNVMVEYSVDSMKNGNVVIYRVYRESTGYTLTGQDAVDLARFAIRAICEGWMKVK